MWTQNQGFRHIDKLAAIDLAEKNGTRNRAKSITVQHFNDSGQPDSPAELVLTAPGHSPVSMQSIAGGYYIATENDAEKASQAADQLGSRDREFANR